MVLLHHTPFCHRKLKHIKGPQSRAGAGNGNTPLISPTRSAHEFGLRVIVTWRRRRRNTGDRYDRTGTSEGYRHVEAEKKKHRRPLRSNWNKPLPGRRARGDKTKKTRVHVYARFVAGTAFEVHRTRTTCGQTEASSHYRSHIFFKRR